MNTVVKRNKFQKLARGWLDWFVAEILGLFFSIMTIGLFSNKVILWFVIIAQLLFLFGMMYCCGQRTAKYDRLKISGVTGYSVKWAIELGVCANIPIILTTVVQLVLQICSVKSFLPFYKLLNIYFMPIIYLFEPDSTKGTMTPACYAVIFGLCAVSVFVAAFTYTLVYKDVDIKALFMYERK